MILLLGCFMSRQGFSQEVSNAPICKSLLNRCHQKTNIARQSIFLKNQSNQIIKVRLKLSGPDDEWIRIETSSNESGETVLSAYHTKRVRQKLWSNVATGVLGLGAGELVDEVIDDYDGPVPIPSINVYRWADHATRRIAFVPVGCSDMPTSLGDRLRLGKTSCVLTGTKSITLPAGMDIRVGLLTIEYLEEELVRTITFEVPPAQQ